GCLPGLLCAGQVAAVERLLRLLVLTLRLLPGGKPRTSSGSSSFLPGLPGTLAVRPDLPPFVLLLLQFPTDFDDEAEPPDRFGLLLLPPGHLESLVELRELGGEFLAAVHVLDALPSRLCLGPGLDQFRRRALLLRYLRRGWFHLLFGRRRSF